MLSSKMLKWALGLTCAQAVWAIDVQQNYSICNWARLRSGIVRDAIYLDGGLLWWQTAFVDGSQPVVASDGNVAGDMWRLNLSHPFDTTKTNLSALLDAMPKAGGAGNNIAPNYVDGTMFVNNDELYLYGGLPRLTDSVSAQSESAVLGYEAYQYGPQRDSWMPGFYQGNLDNDVTRYITNGAGASAPSENLGFYFSGMRAADWGPITYDEANADVTANTLIEVDMSVMRAEEWSNSTLPDHIVPRADAELVWLPVSERGVLIAIGGVTSPEEISPMGLDQTQIEESENVSPSFMNSFPIYDVASKQWFIQNTTTADAPPQLTSFCSVMASNEDNSVFNIYIYGGYDGITTGDPPSDDVWVLSIPSFTWTKVYSGTPSHGRSGHRCLSPYPDKMFVIGGMHQNQAECVEGGFIQVFNLNSLDFQNEYDPDDWDDYKMPDAISTNGNQKRQTQWTDPALADIFATKYEKKIQHYYPFQSDGSVDNDDSGSSGGNTTDHTVAIAVGIAGALVFIVLCIVLLLILRRRKIMRSSNGSESTGTKQSRIGRWVMGTRVSPPKHNNESVSSLTPDMQQIDYAPPVRVSDIDPPTPSFANGGSPYTRVHPPQEMAAVERPKPPFEMATPYNQEGHPRHSDQISYNYTATKGHSPSRSNSSEYESYEPVQEHSPLNTPSHLHPSDAIHQTHGYSASKSTTSTSSSTSAPGWPFPSSKPKWTRTPSSEDPVPGPVPTIPARYQNARSLSYDTTPARLRPSLPGSDPSSTSNPYSDTSGQKVSSMSSGPYEADTDKDYIPSPEASLPPAGTPYGDHIRSSLMERVEHDVVSPISPDATGGPGWKGVWGYGAQEGPRRAEDRGRNSGEGHENWWRRQQ
jgi:hypothetical protein